MGWKNIAGKKNLRTCAKLQKYYNLFKSQFKIALKGYLDKFLTWISVNLPKEALNTWHKIQYTIGTNFWNTLYLFRYGADELENVKSYKYLMNS